MEEEVGIEQNTGLIRPLLISKKIKDFQKYTLTVINTFFFFYIKKNFFYRLEWSEADSVMSRISSFQKRQRERRKQMRNRFRTGSTFQHKRKINEQN